jgi:hypothetical protein
MNEIVLLNRSVSGNHKNLEYRVLDCVTVKLELLVDQKRTQLNYQIGLGEFNADFSIMMEIDAFIAASDRQDSTFFVRNERIVEDAPDVQKINDFIKQDLLYLANIIQTALAKRQFLLDALDKMGEF